MIALARTTTNTHKQPQTPGRRAHARKQPSTTDIPPQVERCLHVLADVGVRLLLPEARGSGGNIDVSRTQQLTTSSSSSSSSSSPASAAHASRARSGYMLPHTWQVQCQYKSFMTGVPQHASGLVLLRGGGGEGEEERWHGSGSGMCALGLRSSILR